jgi:murein DD-endopeptidase MepM/ murein hydrolase activator NlpD
LRGNQVWLKTSKWDLIFYSHLAEIENGLKEWQKVFEWQTLGTVGITGVPDKNYTDYHLHFELRKNPYDLKMAWKYTLQDYMNWDWYFKWKSAQYIQQNQYTIFQK